MKARYLIIPGIAIFVLILVLIFYADFSKCDGEGKQYIAEGEDCLTVQFLCAPGYENFEDDCGCGCKIVSNYTNQTERNYCTEESRNTTACILLYQPVCGWFNSSIQCIRYPCASTYSNSCFACAEGMVEYWTNGECPN